GPGGQRNSGRSEPAERDAVVNPPEFLCFALVPLVALGLVDLKEPVQRACSAIDGSAAFAAIVTPIPSATMTATPAAATRRSIIKTRRPVSDASQTNRTTDS